MVDTLTPAALLDARCRAGSWSRPRRTPARGCRGRSRRCGRRRCPGVDRRGAEHADGERPCGRRLPANGWALQGVLKFFVRAKLLPSRFETNGLPAAPRPVKLPETACACSAANTSCFALCFALGHLRNPRDSRRNGGASSSPFARASPEARTPAPAAGSSLPSSSIRSASAWASETLFTSIRARAAGRVPSTVELLASGLRITAASFSGSSLEQRGCRRWNEIVSTEGAIPRRRKQGRDVVVVGIGLLHHPGRRHIVVERAIVVRSIW